MPHVQHIEDGVAYPSVTEIRRRYTQAVLDAWHQKWGKRAEQKTRAATNVGTEFHKYAEQLVYAHDVHTDYMTRRIYNMLNRFQDWIITNKFRVLDTELHVVSRTYKYAGTFDAIGYIAEQPKMLRLFDWKTSSAIYPEMALQLSAYAQAYYEQTGIRITKGVIVHVSKDKPHHKLTVKEYTLGKRLFSKFLKKLEYYNETRLMGIK